MKRWVACLFGTLLAGTAVAQQQVIEWDTNRAQALGTGCNQMDTFFIQAGNEVSVVFSTLGVELTGYMGGAKVARKNCRIVIPTKVRAGYYMGKLQQTLTYGYNRSGGTDGKIQVTTKFYEQNAGTIQKTIPTGGLDQYDAPFAEAKNSTTWRVLPGWCTRHDYVGNYKAQFTVTGYRRSTSNDIIIQIDGQDIRFDALGYPLLCP